MTQTTADLAESLVQETIRAQQAVGVELSLEKAQEIVREGLEEVWGDYLRFRFIRQLGLPTMVVPPDDEDSD